MTTSATTTTVELSDHAIERFAERVRPGVSLERAGEELAAMALVGDITTDPPAWHAARCAQFAPAYLVLADVVLPLAPKAGDPDVLVATTCIPRGALTPDGRRHRTAARRRRARSRAMSGSA